jgi:LmbE family N-acetylglucosaminyl deacetylase
MTTDLASITSLGTVLGIWAHPDDEAYLSGGLMAAAIRAGSRVACVTATRGERGTSDPVTWPPERLGARRERELRASLAALGVGEHRFLDVVDGTCAQQPTDGLVWDLVAVIDEIAPATIVTFGPDGYTGHEDHRTVSRWATAAHRLAAPDATLLYATSTDEFADRWQALHAELDVFLTPELPLRTPASEVAVLLRLDEDLADRKFASLRAQTSQTASLISHLGETRYRDWCSVETFVDAAGTPAGRWDARTAAV